MSSEGRPGTSRRIGAKLLVSLATLAVLALVCEVGWRVHLYRTGHGFWDDPREFTSPFFTTYEEPRPFVSPAGFEYHNGFVPRAKEPGEIRVLCLGGSTTVNRREGISYAQLIEPRLAEHAPGRIVRVLNAGGDGYSTAHSLVNLALRNLDARPDIVTVYEDINDLSAIRFGDALHSDYGNKYKTDFYLGMRHRSGPLAGLTKMSRLARHLANQVMAIRFPTPEEDAGHDWRQGLVYFERNLRGIVAIARANGIRVALATQPARKDVREEQGFAAYNAAVRDLAREEGLVLIEVEREVTEDRYFLPDAIHYTREGVEAVAERFYPPLADMVEAVVREQEGK